MKIERNKNGAQLSVCCQANPNEEQLFNIEIYNNNKGTKECCCIKSGETRKICIEGGCYTISATSCSDLSPGGITKWLKVLPRQHYGMKLLFSEEKTIMLVPVSFTVSDATYPGITELNGGITVWQKRITL